MKFTTLFTSSLLLSIASAAHNLVDQDSDVNGLGLEKVYVNANGDVVIPEVFSWGNIAVKEKDAAKPRTCGGHVDASGRLGKRTPTCPYGYAIACDAYSANPCCPVDSPLCCIGSSVCCGTGTFCQGNSTCCLIGQVGCGEACCSYGQVCCGSNCCGAGFTCSASNTCVPPAGYTSSTSSSSSSSSSIESSYIYTRSPPIYTTDSTSSNPYGYNPSYTPSSSSSSISSSIIPTCTVNCTTTPPSSPPSNTNTGIVGGVLGAFCLVLILAAAWLFWKKRHAEHLYAEACAPTKPVEPTGGGGGGGSSYTPEPKPAAPTGYTAPATTYATPAPAPAPAPATYTPTPAPATSY